MGAVLASTRDAGLAILISLAALRCDGTGRATAVSVASTPASLSDTAATAPEAGASHQLDWAEAVRRERWPEAAQQIDRLPGPLRTKPEVLYARARVARAQGDAKLALSLLNGLEQGLPLLAADIPRWRAEAASTAGPYGEAASYFAARSTPDAMLKAAAAFERAGEVGRARAQSERVLSSERRSRLQEAAARAMRARLAEGTGDRTTAAADARWVAVHAPDAPGAKEADVALARLSPERALTAEELMARARALADAGRTDDSLHALDRVA